MIGQGVKNYFKNLKYIFNPLGTIALGFVLGISLFIPLFIGAINTLVETVKATFSNVTIDLDVLKESLQTSFTSLNWEEPFEALKLMLSKDWIMQTLQACLSVFVGSMDAYTIPLNNAVNEFLSTLLGGFYGLACFVLLGILSGYLLIKFLVRRNLAKRSFKKYILAVAINCLLTFILILLSTWLYIIWKYSVFFTIFIAFIILGFIELAEGYFVHGDKKVKWKEVVSLKNIAKLFATDLIILAITMTIVLILIYLINIYIGIFVGIALVQIALVVISLNSETYVISMVNKNANILDDNYDIKE